jgi:membrane-associated phospholipid phosphatase
MVKRISFVWVALVCLVVVRPSWANDHAVDSVQIWNGLALDTIRVKRGSDSDAARLYAMVNAAMYDAVNGLLSRTIFAREPALVPPGGAPLFADFPAAASAAAHAVLSALYPDQAARFDAQLAADLAALAGRPGVNAGRSWGAAVGAQVVAVRANDGSSPLETQPAGSGPGVFRAAWSGTQYRNLVPFIIANPADFVGSAPPALDSLAYAAAFAEVKLLGNAAIPDAENLDTFQYWALAAGTAQPPGEWVKIALEVAAARDVPFIEETRLLALVAMAEADTVAPTVTTKVIYQHWRPATAIREADTDGNPQTDPDPTWAPRAGGIGGTPQQWSGHSSFSAAAAAILAGFFCRDNIAFTHVSDSAPGGRARTYTGFGAAAAEAGRSRVLGGIHFEFGNQAGLEAGRNIASEVLAKALLHRFGPKHFGSCPL